MTFAQNSLLSKEHFKYLNKTFEEIFKGTKKGYLIYEITFFFLIVIDIGR